MYETYKHSQSSCGLIAIHQLTGLNFKAIKNWFLKHTGYRRHTKGTTFEELQRCLDINKVRYSVPEDGTSINDILMSGKPAIFGVFNSHGGHWMYWCGYRVVDCNYDIEDFWEIRDQYIEDSGYSEKITCPVLLEVPWYTRIKNITVYLLMYWRP